MGQSLASLDMCGGGVGGGDVPENRAASNAKEEKEARAKAVRRSQSRRRSERDSQLPSKAAQEKLTRRMSLLRRQRFVSKSKSGNRRTDRGRLGEGDESCISPTNQLTSVEGLEKLHAVNGGCISNSNQLTDVKGLEKLTQVRGAVSHQQ